MVFTGYLIMVITFFAAYILFNKLDKSECRWKKANRALIAVFVVTLLAAYGLSLNVQKISAVYIIGSVLLGYLTFCAFTDYTDKYIYAFPLPAICCIFAFISKCSLQNIVLLVVFIAVLYILCCLAGNMGKGDIYAISAASILLGNIEKVAICLTVSLIIFVLYNLRYINWRMLKLDEGRAYVPAVLFGVITALLL